MELEQWQLMRFLENGERQAVAVESISTELSRLTTLLESVFYEQIQLTERSKENRRRYLAGLLANGGSGLGGI